MNHRLVSLITLTLLTGATSSQTPAPAPQNPAVKPAAPSPAEQAQANKMLNEAAALRVTAEKRHHEAIDLQLKAASDNRQAEADFRKANALETEAHKLLKDQNKQAAASLRNLAHDLQRRANQLAVEGQQHKHRATEVQEGTVDIQKAINELKAGGPATANEVKTLEKSMADAKTDESAEMATAAKLDGEVKKLRAEAETLIARANQLDPQGKDAHAPLAPHKLPAKQ